MHAGLHIEADTEVDVSRQADTGAYVLSIGSVQADSPSGAVVEIFAPRDEDMRRIADAIYAHLNPEPVSTVDAGADPQDTCEVWDDDPTTNPPDGAEICGEHRTQGALTRFVCTRIADHTGQHVAGTGDQVVAVWPQSTEPGSAGQPAADRGKGGHEVLTSPHLPADPSTTSDGA